MNSDVLIVITLTVTVCGHHHVVGRTGRVRRWGPVGGRALVGGLTVTVVLNMTTLSTGTRIGCQVRATYGPRSMGACSARELHDDFVVRGILMTSRVGMACSVCSHFVFNNTVPMGGRLSLSAVSPLGTPCFLFGHRLNIVGVNNSNVMAMSNGRCRLGFGRTLCMKHNGRGMAFGDGSTDGPTGFCVGSTVTRGRCGAR